MVTNRSAMSSTQLSISDGSNPFRLLIRDCCLSAESICFTLSCALGCSFFHLFLIVAALTLRIRGSRVAKFAFEWRDDFIWAMFAKHSYGEYSMDAMEV